MRQINKSYKNTIIIIACRFTALSCDYIYCLNKGKIVEHELGANCHDPKTENLIECKNSKT